MTEALYFAALLAVVMGFAHSYLGEKYILTRLFRRDNLPAIMGSVQFTTRTLRFAWHITTFCFWGFAAILIELGRGTLTSQSVSQIIAITFLIMGLTTLIASRARHLAWIVMLAIAGISFYAS